MSIISVYYGIHNQYVDVTGKLINSKDIDDFVEIPTGDHNRANIFGGDPLPDILKSVFLQYENNSTLTEIDHEQSIKIKLSYGTIKEYIKFKLNHMNIVDNSTIFSLLHNNLKITNGNFNEELNEQTMSVNFLYGQDRKVLELGGNIGRNSLIIASIIANDTNLVVFECDSNSANILEYNKSLNGFKFNVESCALSENRIAFQGWNSITLSPTDNVPDWYIEASTMTFNTLTQKYGNFDTLVADCEGALYYILKDTPQLLDNINLILMENDYVIYEHKLFIDQLLLSHGFTKIYNCPGGWGPCYDFFWETWKKQ